MRLLRLLASQGCTLAGSEQPQRDMNVLGQQRGLTPERQHLLRSIDSEAALLKWPLAWLPSTLGPSDLSRHSGQQSQGGNEQVGKLGQKVTSTRLIPKQGDVHVGISHWSNIGN